MFLIIGVFLLISFFCTLMLSVYMTHESATRSRACPKYGCGFRASYLGHAVGAPRRMHSNRTILILTI